jgi:hypothetical protein
MVKINSNKMKRKSIQSNTRKNKTKINYIYFNTHSIQYNRLRSYFKKKSNHHGDSSTPGSDS